MAKFGSGVRSAAEVTQRIREVLDDATHDSTATQAVAAAHSAVTAFVTDQDIGDYTNGTIATAVPDAFIAAEWTVADEGSGATMTVTVKRLPKTNGAAITDIEYTTDGGSNWATIGAGAPALGSYDIGNQSDGATALVDDTEYTVALRAVNSVGNGAASDNKTVTPTAP